MLRTKAFPDCFHQGTFNNPKRMKGTCIRSDWAPFGRVRPLSGMWCICYPVFLVLLITACRCRTSFFSVMPSGRGGRLGKWPVPPAERKRGIAAGWQQAASLNVTSPKQAPPLGLFSVSCLNSSKQWDWAHATPLCAERRRRGSGHTRWGGGE